MLAHFGHDVWIQPRMFRWRYISWAAARNQTVSLHQSLDGIFQSKDFYILYIYRPTNSMPFLMWLSYEYTQLFLFLCSQYLYHIALHRADLRHCGCFKVCNLPTGPLPTGRVFWTSKMPACGSWWSTLVNTLIYIENIQTCGESGSCRWIGGEGVLMFLRCGQQTITMHDIVQFGVI